MSEPPEAGVPVEPSTTGPNSLANCVCCHWPIRGRVREVAGRPYCAEHYARATLGSRGTWPALAAMLFGLLALAFVMFAIGSRVSDALDDRWLVLVGFVLAVVPTLLWLGIFRELDRLEPEPHQYLLSVTILAALLTGVVAEPLRRDVFALHTWQPDAWYWSILVNAMIQGVIQATVVYVTVRYTVFLSDEFDERADGIIYGTAAGLGCAMLLNFHYVLDHPGLRLDVGTARIIVAALVLASLGGLVGYGLGQVKFERHSAWFAAGFVVAVALLNGSFDWLVTEISRRQFGSEGWPAVVAGTLFALIVLGIVYGLLQHAVRETHAGVNHARRITGGPDVGAGVETLGGGTEGQSLDFKEFSPRASHGDLIVFAMALLLVVAGGVLKQIHDNRTVSVDVGGITVTYPRGWFRYSVQAPEFLRVVSNEDGATTLILLAEPAGQTGLVEAIGSGIGNPAAVKTAYVQLAHEQIDLRAIAAYRTDYAYVDTAVSGAFPPEVIRGRQITWIMNGQVHVLALESPERSWEESKGLFQPIVDQLQI